RHQLLYAKQMLAHCKHSDCTTTKPCSIACAAFVTASSTNASSLCNESTTPKRARVLRAEARSRDLYIWSRASTHIALCARLTAVARPCAALADETKHSRLRNAHYFNVFGRP